VALQYDRPTGFVYPGRLENWDGTPLYGKYEENGASRHMTFVFTTFVMMQIFNMFCSRKIHDEFWIFEGICGNPMFIVIFLFILAGQFVITQYGTYMFVVCVDGLDPIQWAMAVAIGMTTFIVNFLLKFVPDWLTPSLG
jgi:magnesium-transporting ATPase (P-type)